MTFEEIKDFDHQVCIVVKPYCSKYQDAFVKLGLNNTGEALLLLNKKMTHIKNSIYEVIKTEDIYSSKILHRVMLEHNLKFMYILLRLAYDKSDMVGKEYNIIYKIFEKIDISKYNLDKSKELDIKAYYQKEIQEYPELKNTTFEQANKIKNQFTNKNIVRFLKGFKEMEQLKYLKDILNNYSVLSSFIHGGPYATTDTFYCVDPLQRTRVLELVCGQSFGVILSNHININNILSQFIESKNLLFKLQEIFNNFTEILVKEK